MAAMAWVTLVPWRLVKTFCCLKALLHVAICFATCNAILLLRDVKLANTCLCNTPLANSSQTKHFTH